MRDFIKIINKTNLKHVIILLFLLSIFIFISAVSYVDAVSTNIANSVFRLHVIANSDSDEDQELKYNVRDELLKYMNTISENCSSKEDVIKLAIEHKDDFEKIAKEVIKENGYNYDVNIKIGQFDFPTKDYGDISLPAGLYDALRVEIGEAKGQNWWCVMFPPLCFVDVTSGVVPNSSKELLQDNLDDEEYSLINKNNSENEGITFKFKLIEFFQNLKFSSK